MQSFLVVRTSCWDFKWEQEVNGERHLVSVYYLRKPENIIIDIYIYI